MVFYQKFADFLFLIQILGPSFLLIQSNNVLGDIGSINVWLVTRLMDFCLFEHLKMLKSATLVKKLLILNKFEHIQKR